MYGPPKATGFRVVTIDSEGQNTLQGTVTLPKLENAITRAGISELIAQTTGLEHAKYDLVGKSENGKQLQLTCDEDCQQFFNDCTSQLPTIECFPAVKATIKQQAAVQDKRKEDHVLELEQKNATLEKTNEALQRRIEILEKRTSREASEMRELLSQAQKIFANSQEQIEKKLEHENEQRAQAWDEKIALIEQQAEQDALLTRGYDGRLQVLEKSVRDQAEQIESFLKNSGSVLNDLMESVKKLRHESDGTRAETTTMQGDIEKLRVTCVPESVHQDKVREIFNRMEGNHEEVSDALSKFQTTTEERQSMIECAVKEVHDRLVAAGKKMMEDLVLLDDRISVKCHAVDEHVSTHVEDLQKVVLHVQEQAVERGEVEALTEYLAKEFKHVDNAMGVVKVQVSANQTAVEDCVKVCTTELEKFETMVRHKMEANKTLTMEKVELNKVEYDVLSQVTKEMQDKVMNFFEYSASKTELLQQDAILSSKEIDLFKKEFEGVQSFSEQTKDALNAITDKIRDICICLEPIRAEWRIEKLGKKIAKIADDRFVRSDVFKLNGVDSLRMDFYPQGLDSAVYQDGVACLRIFGPSGSRFKYEVAIGNMRDSEGTRTFNASAIVQGGGAAGTQMETEGSAEKRRSNEDDDDPENGLWVDIFFPNWEREIVRDAVLITLEVTENAKIFGSVEKVKKLKNK